MDKVFQMDNKKLIQLFVVVSILFHAFFLVLKSPSISISNALTDPEEDVIRIKLTPQNTKMIKQIVQTEQMNNKEKPIDKAFLGKHDNKVDRQTRSAKTGTFKKSGIGSKDATEMQKTVTENIAKKKELKNIKFSDLGMKSASLDKSLKKYRAPSFAQMKGLKNGHKDSRGLGQSNDYIEDIPLGDFTKLNTQEYEFYGFYNRIREKLEQFWGRNIQDQADKMMKSGRSIASDTNHITSLTIELNHLGEIVKVNINAPSGVRELDSAAVETFNQAGPFPNPPTKMLKEGKAQIKWSFVVNT